MMLSQTSSGERSSWLLVWQADKRSLTLFTFQGQAQFRSKKGDSSGRKPPIGWCLDIRPSLLASSHKGMDQALEI